MRVCLLSQDDGMFCNIGKWEYKNPSVQTLARLLQADVWHGSMWNDQVISTLSKSYDTILLNLNFPQAIDLFKSLKAHYSGKLIGIQESGINNFDDYDDKIEIIKTLEKFDQLWIWNENSLDYFSLLNKNVRIVYLPKPHNDLQVWPANKTGIIGINNNFFDNRGTAAAMLLVRKFWPKHLIRVFVSGNGQKTAVQGLIGGDLDVILRLPYVEFLQKMAECEFTVNLDTRYTFGRFVLDMAFIRIPVIGSDFNAVQAKVFPDLIVNPFFHLKAVKILGDKILTDKLWKKNVLDFAAQKLETHFNENVLIKTLRGYLNE